MIQVIYGKKGSGKTKRILDMANHMVDTQHGDVVFVDDDNRYMFDLRHEDVKVIFIDAFLKLTKTTDIAEMGWFFEKLDAYTKAHEIDFVLSIGLDADDLPEFVKPYLI